MQKLAFISEFYDRENESVFFSQMPDSLSKKSLINENIHRRLDLKDIQSKTCLKNEEPYSWKISILVPNERLFSNLRGSVGRNDTGVV